MESAGDKPVKPSMGRSTRLPRATPAHTPTWKRTPPTAIVIGPLGCLIYRLCSRR